MCIGTGSKYHSIWSCAIIRRRQNGKVYVHSLGRQSAFTEEKRTFSKANCRRIAGPICSKTKNQSTIFAEGHGEEHVDEQ